MRIGIDARMLHKAGIRRYAKELVRNLPEIDAVNEYLVYLSSDEQLNEFGEPKSNVSMVRLQAPLFSLKEQLLLIARLKKDRVDVLHTTFDFGAPLRPTCNIIVTVHDVFFGPCTFFRSYRTRLLYQILTKHSVRKASRLIVISDFIREKLLEYVPAARKKADKIRVIPNGVSTEFSPVREPEESRRRMREYGIRGKYIFCVGSFASEIKNLKGILKSYSIMDEKLTDGHQLVIAGEISGRVPEASELIKKLKSLNRILCLGHVPDEDLPDLYRNAEVFIYPSLHEGFGIPILEAMACGTPVVTSNITAMPEVAGEAALFVNPYDIENIKNTLSRVLTNSDMRGELSKKGLERAKNFSWLSTAKKTLGVYKEAANGRFL